MGRCCRVSVSRETETAHLVGNVLDESGTEVLSLESGNGSPGVVRLHACRRAFTPAIVALTWNLSFRVMDFATVTPSFVILGPPEGWRKVGWV